MIVLVLSMAIDDRRPWTTKSQKTIRVSPERREREDDVHDYTHRTGTVGPYFRTSVTVSNLAVIFYWQ